MSVKLYSCARHYVSMRDHVRDVGRDNQREREIGGEGDGNDMKKGGVHPWAIYVSKLLAIFAFPFNLPTCYASLKWFVSLKKINYCSSITISIKVLFLYTFSNLIRITLLLLLWWWWWWFTSTRVDNTGK